ncbi:Dihydroorotate dehydrogenase B (NAD(+)), electron transfer subunit [Vibrio stylophorae]|uniref:Dihydroorotate dehydrogenase B (NAD(+)), electron transfer subunit n=1 Tax=Vibrio stylophorae TaxID=659351 RepID=A0ABN8DWE7_9VIBR|nr:ferric reductase-like transmembrane domain-containing protein [Vibrio stylophorae]CAH0535542.1 Dihydroorotate dehydrogenase B (NAD(+)), electron transfer subunit [Vibrio stylophorae]
MKKASWMIALLILLCSVFWLHADWQILKQTHWHPIRSGLLQLTGILSITLFSLTMILAMRFRWVDAITTGLDKSYRLHKWSAIFALVFALVHWLLALVPKMLVQRGLLERPIKSMASQPAENIDSIMQWLHQMRPMAEQMGDIGIKLMILLMIAALLKRLPYHWFQWSHKLMALLYLAFVVHTVILLKPSYWDQPITWLTLLFVIVGSLCAVASLLGKVGNAQRYQGRIRHISHRHGVTALTVHLPRWPGHQSGQFAFIRLAGEKAHPFTITSSAAPSTTGALNAHQLRFSIKALGDFTGSLPTMIQSHDLVENDQVEIEGPYGQFDFDTHTNSQSEQIWIAGGIGIAGFLAKLEERAKLNSVQPQVTLYFCTQDASRTQINQLAHQARIANVDFHLIDNRKQPLLTISTLEDNHPQFAQASIWFCGPANFAKALAQQLKAKQFAMQRFHREYFEFR